MVGAIDIRVNAAHPNLVIDEVYAFTQSPSSFRITGVPTKIGTWDITAVRIEATYPDNVVHTVSCVLSDGAWTGTVEGCERAGRTVAGFRVIADGIDENGGEVTGYVLGVGDLCVMNRNLRIGGTMYALTMHDERPSKPCMGDVVCEEGEWRIYDGEDWVRFGGVTSYDDLADLPSVNGVVLSGDRTSHELGLASQDDIPTLVSELSNDAGYSTVGYVDSAVSAESEERRRSEHILQQDIGGKVSLSGDTMSGGLTVYATSPQRDAFLKVRGARCSTTIGEYSVRVEPIQQASGTMGYVELNGEGLRVRPPTQSDYKMLFFPNGKGGTIVIDDDLSAKADRTHTHSVADISGFPTGVSYFENDCGYLTSHQPLSDYYTKAEAVSAFIGKAWAEDQNSQFKGVSEKAKQSYEVQPQYVTTKLTFDRDKSRWVVAGLYGTGTLAFTSEIPTLVSELSNDAGYSTEGYVDSAVSAKADRTHTHGVADIRGLPTNVSHFVNDCGYLSGTTVKDGVEYSLQNFNGIVCLCDEDWDYWYYDIPKIRLEHRNDVKPFVSWDCAGGGAFDVYIRKGGGVLAYESTVEELSTRVTELEGRIAELERGGDA